MERENSKKLRRNFGRQVICLPLTGTRGRDLPVNPSQGYAPKKVACFYFNADCISKEENDYFFF